MSTLYQPNDSLIGPIVHELAQIITNQIAGVSRVYEEVPDGPPENNSAVIPLSKFEVVGDTNGKLYLKLTFGIRHCIERANFADNISTAYSYIIPYLQAFASWSNQSLNGLAQLSNISKGGVSQETYAGQVFVCLVCNVEVLTEFNIPTS